MNYKRWKNTEQSLNEIMKSIDRMKAKIDNATMDLKIKNIKNYIDNAEYILDIIER